VDATDARNPKYVAILAGVACLILAVGWFVRPREIPQSPAPVPSETELHELARRAQRRSLESMTAYFADLATDLRPSLSYIRPAGSSGIVWDGTHIVTGPVGLDPRSLTVGTASGDVRPTRTISSRRLPLSALEILHGLSGSAIAHRAAALPQAGDWIVGASSTSIATSSVSFFRVVTV
jgi:hypothetical protein